MAVILNSFSGFYPLAFFFFFIQFSVLNCPAGGSGDGFTAELIHRNSPLSPLYNPSSNKLNHLGNAFRRSFSRADSFKQALKSSDDGIQSQIVPTSGEYLIKLSIGTPPVQMFGIADTGSDLTWTQCKPCTKCYEQNSPYFDPKNSSSYRELSCLSQPCQAVASSSASTCTDSGSICRYRMTYGDKSFSVGHLAVETFTFGSPTSGHTVLIPMVFGCGHDDEGTFNETATGIVGLGGGKLSFISQLDATIQGKFSYCLAPLDPSDSNLTSKITFGDDAAGQGAGVVSTPIIKKSIDTFYYLTLESITVKNKSLTYKTPSKSKSADAVEYDLGNIIIDSGTTLTFLPRYLYENLESELKQVIEGEPTPDSQGFLSLCYSNIDETKLPTITAKFTGANLELPPSSTFVQNGDGLLCLAMVPSDDLAIFGNLSQMNFLISYDLVESVVSFMPTDCTKYN